MMGLPNWLRRREGDFDMTHDEVPLPPIAYTETREQAIAREHAVIDRQLQKSESTGDQAAVVVQAHTFIEQWKQERVTQQKTIELLQIEVTELVFQLESERRKIAVVELDLATAQNDLQTQQSQIEEYRRFMSLTRQVLDKFDVQALPKKERKPNAKATKTTERKAASQPIPEALPEGEKPFIAPSKPFRA